MINTLFFAWALFPVAVGMGFLLKPRMMRKSQAWFRKRMERLEAQTYKAHRKVGVLFMLFGFMMIYTYFQPIWIYNMFAVARVVMGLFFPEMEQQMQQVEAVPMVCI